MDCGSNLGLYWKAYGLLLRGSDITREQKKKMKAEYTAIAGRAKDIGRNNRLLGSYLLAAFFIAMVRATGKSPEECHRIIENGWRKSFLMTHFFGNADAYLAEKKMPGRIAWDKETHERKYENDWVVDVLGPTKDYDLGYDYTECGVVKLCRDEGVPEYATWLCKLDFMIASFIGLDLERTGTLADGADKCDFRYIRRDRAK